MTTKIEFVPVDLIDPHPHNPRRDLGDLTELADSIRTQGIRQNLLITPWGTDGDRYRAIIGHRRLAAAKLAGLEDVPCVIDETITAEEQLELMLLENIQRSDLSPVEEAEGYQQLLDLGVKVRQIAKTTGRAESTVTARLRLMKLPEDARAKVHSHEATLEDAAKLDAFVAHPKLMEDLAQWLGTANWRWKLEDAQHRLRTEENRKHLRVALKKVGVPQKPGPDGWAARDWRVVAKLKHEGDLGKAVAEGLPDGVVWADSYGGLDLLRPTTTEEKAAADAQEAERDADWERRRSFQELDDQAREEGLRAFRLRDEWAREFLSRKRVAAKDQLAILAAAVPALLFYNQSHYWALHDWLDMREQYADHDMTDAAAAQFPGADPTGWLLVALHLAAKKQAGWAIAWQHPPTVALYGLLEQLGYPVSDAERARITPPADDEAAEDEAVAS